MGIASVAATLRVVPLSLAEANALVARWHRHHAPAVGHRYSIGIMDERGEPHGAAIIGRPVARMTDWHRVAEITRLVTDGTPNACSMLYGAAARAADALGFDRIQTFILDTEPGTSLRAAGWAIDGLSAGGQWVHTAGPRRTDQPTNPKVRYAKEFRHG